MKALNAKLLLILALALPLVVRRSRELWVLLGALVAWSVVATTIGIAQFFGWSVLEAVAKLPAESRPRVVMVTALASSVDQARAKQMGAAAYVPKPFDMDQLVGVLQGLALAS